MAERLGWQQQAEALRFKFHSIDGTTPYWDESIHYGKVIARADAHTA